MPSHKKNSPSRSLTSALESSLPASTHTLRKQAQRLQRGRRGYRLLAWLVRILLVLLGTAAALLLLAGGAFLLSNRTNGSLVSSGEKRSYLLYVPDSYDPAKPTPLVITIHGFAQWPAHQAQLTHWNDLADEYGFIAVYPSGTDFPKRWRTGGDTPVDVLFISALIDQLESDYNIDPQRIYANGLSNGGGMSMLLACQLSGRIAAVGSVGGAYTFPWSACQPERPVPAIIFHGTADPVVPYYGGPSHSFAIDFPLVPAWVDVLAGRNGCSSTPVGISAQGQVSGLRYTGCAQDAEVIFYTISGGGHTWPGGDPLPEFITGYTSQDMNATQAIWNFFQQHPLPGK